jgi:predicted transcriptional regulator
MRGGPVTRLDPEQEWLLGAAGMLMHAHGIKQTTTARALGVPQSALSQWVNRRRDPSRRPGTHGARYWRLLAGLLRAETARRDTAAEVAEMEAEGHAERWAQYDRGWHWELTDKCPRVVASRRRSQSGRRYPPVETGPGGARTPLTRGQ